MPLSLEQYADYLDSRDLPWPSAPEPDPPKARPHLVEIPGLKAVLWDLYGTLLCVIEGELLFEHPKEFVMDMALDKTIQEFKMWQSMSRKPGQPSEYMKELYDKALFDVRAMSGAPDSAKLWESLLKKLFLKEYSFDAGFYGSLNEYSEKVAYFFHASLQGTACYPGAVEAIEVARDAGLVQGLLADGQCFSPLQLSRSLKSSGMTVDIETWLPKELRVLSVRAGFAKPAEGLFRAAVAAVEGRGIRPGQVLHVGSSLQRDIGPAKKVGFKTALFAGDKRSLRASPELLKQPAYRPDVMLTELSQLRDVIG